MTVKNPPTSNDLSRSRDGLRLPVFGHFMQPVLANGKWGIGRPTFVPVRVVGRARGFAGQASQSPKIRA